MVKSAASTVMLIGMIVIVTSAVAVALRLHGLACYLARARRRGGRVAMPPAAG